MKLRYRTERLEIRPEPEGGTVREPIGKAESSVEATTERMNERNAAGVGKQRTGAPLKAKVAGPAIRGVEGAR